MDIFYVIRFSLRLNPDWELDTFGGDQYRENWFKFRAEVFKRTIYKSIRKQSVTGCKIILLLDEGDVSYYKEYLNLDTVFPVFCAKSDFMEKVASIITNERSDYNKPYIISRVDSDDVLAPTYTHSVLSCLESAVESDDLWIVSTDGARFDLNNYQRLYYSVSPFISYVTSDENIENIYGFNHELVSSKNSVRYLQTENPLWCQILHGSNVANSFWAGSTELDFKISKTERKKACALPLESEQSFNSFFPDFSLLPIEMFELIKKFQDGKSELSL